MIALAWTVIVVIVAAWAFSAGSAYERRLRGRTPKKVDENQWHIRAEIDRLSISRRSRQYQKYGFDTSMYGEWERSEKTFPFQADDPESYGAALAKAEAFLDGLRDIEERTREISAR